MSIKAVRCYGTRKRVIIDNNTLSSFQGHDERQFAKGNLRAQQFVNIEKLTWEAALDPTVFIGSEDNFGKRA
jgi:hypothetical protein